MFWMIHVNLHGTQRAKKIEKDHMAICIKEQQLWSIFKKVDIHSNPIKDPHGEFLHQKKKQRARVMMANNRVTVFPKTWRATWIWIIEEQL